MAVPDLDPAAAETLAEQLRTACPESPVIVDRPLASLTTYSVGGAAAVAVEVASERDLVGLAEVVGRADPPVAVIGRGSNLLVADEGFAGLVVQLGSAFDEVRIVADDEIVVGGAASLPATARQLTAAGRTGFEWAVGVPGSLGGAIRMNAGGHGSDMAASVRSVRVVDLRRGDDGDLELSALRFGYRSSAIAAHQLVVSAVLTLEAGDPARGQEVLKEIVRWRREHQPGGQNAGSVFTNPPGDSAGRLIDVTGCKGLRIGSATVSTKHANFIQADPGGRAGDIVALMVEVVRRVHDATGVVLHAETRMIGFGPDESALMFDPREENR